MFYTQARAPQKFPCSACEKTFLAALNARRCKSHHSAAAAKEINKESKVAAARAAKLRQAAAAEQRQAVKAQEALEVGDSVATPDVFRITD